MTKQLLIRVDKTVHESLKRRSSIEGRSVNEIVGEAIGEYTQAHPISREALLKMARAIAVEDASLLRVLAES